MPSLADALKKIGVVNDEQSAPSMWLDSGYPPLNKILSGSYRKGFALGRMFEIFGPSSSGKTAIATAAMISAQRSGGVAIFMDHERSFDKRLAVKLGLDESPDKWIYLQPKTFEESVDRIVEIIQLIRGGDFGIPKDAPICVVMDSLHAMVPKSKWDKNAADYNMNDTGALARATSSAFPSLAQHVMESDVCLLMLNQLRMKIGVVFGNPETTPGGEAPKFYSSARLQIGGSKMKDDAGKVVTCKTVKNKLNRPFLSCSWDFVFQDDGSGKFDAIGGVIDELTSLGVLEKAGARITWTDGKTYYKSKLTEKIEAEGLQEELFSMLPEDEDA